MKMSKAKNIFALFLTSLFIFSNLIAIKAAQTNPVRVFLDGKQINYDVQPQIINSRTMVPISLTVQALTGVQATYDDATKSMSFVASNGNFVQHKIGDTIIYVNGAPLPEYDTPSVLLSDRTLVPIRMLADATGCTTVWDGINYFVYLTSPPVVQKERPTITTVDPNTYTIDDGGTLNVKVTTNSSTAKVKLSTTANVMIAESTQASVVGDSKIFTISTDKIKTSGKYRIYAGDENSYDNLYYKEIYVTVNAGAKLNSVITSTGDTTFPVNSPITFTVTGTDLTTKVRLVSDTDANDIVESTTYTSSSTGSSSRVFTLTWTPKTTGTRVPKFYAGTDQGYSATSSSLTLNITEAAPVTVFDATPSASTVASNQSFTVTMNTSTSATKVWLNIQNYGNSNTYTTNYTDGANGRRTWTITWSVNMTNQPVTVYAYAADANNNQNYVTFSLNVGSTTSTTGEIISSVSSVSAISFENQQVTVTVTTLTNVNSLLMSYGGYSYNPTSGPISSGGYYTWTFSFPGMMAYNYYDLSGWRTDNISFSSRHYFNQQGTTGSMSIQFNQSSVAANTQVTGTIVTPVGVSSVRYGTYENAWSIPTQISNNGSQITWSFTYIPQTTTTIFAYATTSTGTTISAQATITVTGSATGTINSFTATQSGQGTGNDVYVVSINTGTAVSRVRVYSQNNTWLYQEFFNPSYSDVYSKTWSGSVPVSTLGITTSGTYTLIAQAYDANNNLLGSTFPINVTYNATGGTVIGTAEIISLTPQAVTIQYNVPHVFTIITNSSTTSVVVQVSNDTTSTPVLTSEHDLGNGTKAFYFNYTPTNVTSSQVTINFTPRNASNVNGNPAFATVTLTN